MTGGRMIITGATLTAQVQDIQFELSKVNQVGESTDILQKGTRVMAPGRATSLYYFNSGSGPMFIGISLALSAPGVLGAQLQIGGATVARGDNVANKYFYLMGIAQAGEQCILTATGGVHIGYWMEYGF